MKRKTVIISIAAAVIVTILAGYLNGRFINPSDYHVNYITVKDQKLDESFDGFTIAFITDIEYGTFMDEKRLSKLTKRINELQTDMIIFGGDLFDFSYSPVTADVTLMTNALSSFSAPYGKFAILGDFDQISEARSILVRKILSDSQFELLDGKPLTIHHNSAGFFNLLGFSYADAVPDYMETFNTIDAGKYTLTVVHGGEFAKALPSFSSDLTISGHSHFKQINLPIVVDETSYPHTGGITSRRIKLAGTTLLYMSNGIGTTEKDFRLFCDPEIMVFRFEK